MYILVHAYSERTAQEPLKWSGKAKQNKDKSDLGSGSLFTTCHLQLFLFKTFDSSL